MQELLKMIESVDPADAAALDDIDVEVWQYLNRMAFADVYVGVFGANEPMQKIKPPQYSRSRDALKAIRPKGWEVHLLKGWPDQFLFALQSGQYTKMSSGLQKTEELAELHAIIQAIEFERKHEAAEALQSIGSKLTAENIVKAYDMDMADDMPHSDPAFDAWLEKRQKGSKLAAGISCLAGAMKDFTFRSDQVFTDEQRQAIYKLTAFLVGDDHD